MKKVLAFVLFISLAGQANATFYDATSPGSFSYGGFTWNTSFSPNDNNDGFIATGTDAAVGEVQIVGSDTGSEVALPARALAEMSTTIAESGTISVDWDYFSLLDPAVYDPFVWLLDDVVQLPTITSDGTGSQIGNFTTHVDAGVLFSLAIVSDNLFGGGLYSADVGLSNFSFTADIGGMTAMPVPPAFLLFGTALAGLGFFRKKKAAA